MLILLIEYSKTTIRARTGGIGEIKTTRKSKRKGSTERPWSIFRVASPSREEGQHPTTIRSKSRVHHGDQRGS
jgi:hypothetical protein